jgi:hypothetical protein
MVFKKWLIKPETCNAYLGLEKRREEFQKINKVKTTYFSVGSDVLTAVVIFWDITPITVTMRSKA